jgi:uncharacterized membrane protein YphA (DoxX/SURF4 family)
MVQYVSSKNVPMPDAAVTATGAALTQAGASLVFGVKPAIGAATVAGFLASPIMHGFWTVQDPEKRQG